MASGEWRATGAALAVRAALLLFFGVVLSPASPAAGTATPVRPDSPAPRVALIGPRVALIGWDGATWDVIDPLLKKGKLPHLARLLRNGSRGVLVAEEPLLSPVAWTTLATGFDPARHGVRGFLLPDPRGQGTVLAATFHRRRAALWQMASAGGRSTGFIGWWTTWPAEPVRGYMVSDHLAYNRWDAWAPGGRGNDRLVYPPKLEGTLRPLVVSPDRLSVETLTAIVPFNVPERDEMMRAREPIRFHAPSVFRYAYSTDASTAAFARHLLETRPQPELFAAVFILTDVAGHVFWKEAHPEEGPASFGASPSHLREALPNIYEQVDRWTGEILARLDPSTHVIVLSDHGMRSTGRAALPNRSPAADHAPEGIFVAAGPTHGRADLGRLSSLDLAPTVLALLDLPIARDMPGHFAGALLPLNARASWIDTYGAGAGPWQAASPSSTVDDAYRDRLRSIGYIR